MENASAYVFIGDDEEEEISIDNDTTVQVNNIPASPPSPDGDKKGVKRSHSDVAKTTTNPPNPTKTTVKKATTNVLITNLGTLANDLKEITLHDGSKQENVPTHGGLDQVNNKWTCEFCSTVNDIQLNKEEIPQSNIVDYILEPAPIGPDQKNINSDDDEKKSKDESVILYCIDISGSMMQATLIDNNMANILGVKPSSPNLPVYVPRFTLIKYAIEAQITELKKQYPHRKVGIITFGSEVRVVGDCKMRSIEPPRHKFYDMSYLLETGSSCPAGNLEPISKSFDGLVSFLKNLSSSGFTALGPAVTTAVGMCTKFPGSKIIVCTDGCSNEGLGKLDDNNYLASVNLVETNGFYHDIGVLAQQNGVSISVFGIKGQDCRLEQLGKLADKTSGEINLVEPSNLLDDLKVVFDLPTLATNVTIKLKLHHQLFINSNNSNTNTSTTTTTTTTTNQQNNTDKDNGILIGNVNRNTTTAFEYGLKPNEKIDDSLKSLPFQLQIYYTTLSGMKCVRVITQTIKTTKDKDLAEEHADIEVLGINLAQQPSKMASEGDYESARIKNLQSVGLLHRVHKKKQVQFQQQQQQLLQTVNSTIPTATPLQVHSIQALQQQLPQIGSLSLQQQQQVQQQQQQLFKHQQQIQSATKWVNQSQTLENHLSRALKIEQQQQQQSILQQPILQQPIQLSIPQQQQQQQQSILQQPIPQLRPQQPQSILQQPILQQQQSILQQPILQQPIQQPRPQQQSIPQPQMYYQQPMQFQQQQQRIYQRSDETANLIYNMKNMNSQRAQDREEQKVQKKTKYDLLNKILSTIDKKEYSSVETRDELVKSYFENPEIAPLLSDFDRRQILLNPYAILGKGPWEYPDFASIPFLKDTQIAKKRDSAFSRSPFSGVSELVKLDRSCRLFTYMRDVLHNLVNPVHDVLRLTGFYGFRETLSISLGKYLPDNSMEYCILQLNKSIRGSVGATYYRGQAFPRTYHFEGGFEGSETDCRNYISQKFKELTGREYNPNVKELDLVPTHEHFGYVSETEPVSSYSIPTLENICIGYLKEKYLVDKSILDTIKKLPLPILQKFVNSCYQDSTPIGKECIDGLMSVISDPKMVETLFPPHKLLECDLARERWFSITGSIQSPQNPIYNCYNDQFAINVYENFSRFKFQKYHDPNRVIFEASENSKPVIKEGLPSIVNYETFVDTFNKDFNPLFDKGIFPKEDWENMVVIGGFMTKCITGSEVGFESSDIDIYFYGFSYYQQLEAKVERLMSLFGDRSNYTLCTGNGQLMVVRYFPHRHVQINMNLYSSIESILTGVDIDSSCFAFDGTNVWTMDRGIHSVNTRFNIAHSLGYSIRGEEMYQRRLLKYLDRGFGVSYLPGDGNIERELKTFTSPSLRQHGIAVLFSAKMNPSIFEQMNKKTAKASLPYGPNWDRKKFESYVSRRYDHFYDGYNGNSYPCIVGENESLKECITHCLTFCDNNRNYVCPTSRWELFLQESDLAKRGRYFDDEDEEELSDDEEEEEEEEVDDVAPQ
eukprot:gene3718-4631_t